MSASVAATASTECSQPAPIHVVRGDMAMQTRRRWLERSGVDAADGSILFPAALGIAFPQIPAAALTSTTSTATASWAAGGTEIWLDVRVDATVLTCTVRSGISPRDRVADGTFIAFCRRTAGLSLVWMAWMRTAKISRDAAGSMTVPIPAVDLIPFLVELAPIAFGVQQRNQNHFRREVGWKAVDRPTRAITAWSAILLADMFQIIEQVVHLTRIRSRDRG